jgi:hypothetical protein
LEAKGHQPAEQVNSDETNLVNIALDYDGTITADIRTKFRATRETK